MERKESGRKDGWIYCSWTRKREVVIGKPIIIKLNKNINYKTVINSFICTLIFQETVKNSKENILGIPIHWCSARDWDGKDYLRIIPRVVLVEDPRLT